MKCVGGPLDGQGIETLAGEVTLAAYPDHAYYRTVPSDWTYEPRWWEMGLPEPVTPGPVLEWHERGWVPPAVRAIRDAVSEAAARLT